MTTYNTGDPIGTVSAYNLYDDAENLDLLLLGTELAYNDRLGVSRTSWAGLVKQFLTGGSALAFSNAATLLAFTPTQSNVLAMDAATGNYYYWNGTVWSAISNTSMPWYYDLLVARSGKQYTEVTNLSAHVDGSYYDASGTLQTDGASIWTTFYVPISAAGVVVKAIIPQGSLTAGESIPVFTQLDANKVYVSTLSSTISTGSTGLGTYYTSSSQAGYIAVRVRLSTGLSRNIYTATDVILTASALVAQTPTLLASAKKFGSAEDITARTRAVSYITYDAIGSLVTGKDNTFRVYYVPVFAGQQIYASGLAGAYTNGESLPFMVQLDAAKAYISTLASQTTNGSLATFGATVTATQNGYIAVVCRYASTATYSIMRYEPLLDHTVAVNSRGVVLDVTHECAVTNSYYVSNALVETSDGSSMILKLPVRKGDAVIADALFHSSAAETRVAFAQLDETGAYIAALTSYTSIGTGINRDGFIGVATQNGYVAISIRKSGNANFYVYAARNSFKDSVDDFLERTLERDGVASYTNVAKYEVNNTALDYLGVALTDANYRTVWVPVRKGEQVTAYTATGKIATGETLNTAGTIPYLIWFDYRKAVHSVVSTAANTGALAGYQTVTGVAPKDGYMAVRMYAADRGWPTVKRFKVASSSGSTAAGIPVTQGMFEPMPLNAATNWDYNNCPYSQDNVVYAGDYQYAVVIGVGGVPYIAQRNKLGGAWLAVFDLSTIDGNPLNSPTEEDGHNVYNIGVSASGYIVIAGNMHGSGPRAVVSTNVHDISSWTSIDFSVGLTTGLTYPHFVSYSDGTLQCYFRYGARHYLTTFNETTKAFENLNWIVGAKSDGTGGPYEQKYVVDNSDVLHVCWGYRQNASSALDNEGLWYAKSADKGATWLNADGTSITNNSSGAKLNNSNTVRIYDAELQSGYVNQNGAAVDTSGCYHTTLMQYDSNGYMQIVHIWFDGATWTSEVVTSFNFAMDLSSNLVTNDITRPVLGCTPNGKTYIFYHTSYNNLSNSIRAIDVSTAGAPVDMSIAAFDIGYQSLGFNVAYMLKTGYFMALLAKGTANSSSSGYGTHANQPIMLAKIPMP